MYVASKAAKYSIKTLVYEMIHNQRYVPSDLSLSMDTNESKQTLYLYQIQLSVLFYVKVSSIIVVVQVCTVG